MSWRLLRGCSVMLWFMTALMLAATGWAGLHDLSIIVPVILAGATAIAGFLFWRTANEQHAAQRVVVSILEQQGMSEDLAKGLVEGELTYEQFEALCEWIVEEHENSTTLIHTETKGTFQ